MYLINCYPVLIKGTKKNYLWNIVISTLVYGEENIYYIDVFYFKVWFSNATLSNFD